MLVECTKITANENVEMRFYLEAGNVEQAAYLIYCWIRHRCDWRRRDTGGIWKFKEAHQTFSVNDYPTEITQFWIDESDTYNVNYKKIKF